MSIYASWSRVEPDHRATDPRTGARSPVADPFWSLGRQWWIGELEGFDGGSPVASRVEVATVDLSGGYSDSRHAVLSARLAAPVPEPGDRLAGDWRTAYRLGRSAAAVLSTLIERLTRMVEAGRIEPAALQQVEEGAARLPQDFPLDVPAIVEARLPADERIDGIALLTALRAGDDRVSSVEEHLAEWVAAQASVMTGDDADTFAVETGHHTVELTGEGGSIRSDTAQGPALHWSDLTIGTVSSATTETQAPVPVRLSFEGAPPIRWWGIEEPEVDYAAAPAGPSDLGQLLVAASLQEQGGVYWRLPIDVQGNSLLRVESVVVLDGFGNRRNSTSLEGGALQGWKLGDDAQLRPDPTTDLMLILNEPDPLRGEPLEEVSLAADETDNLIWMILDIVPDEFGRGSHVSQPTPRPDPSREEYIPRLAPPDAWIAYQQTGPASLERATLVPFRAQAVPTTRFARQRLKMTPAMLGAGGHRLRRQWSLARSASGRRIVWQSRRSLAYRPRGGSGLLHDQIVRPEP